MYGIKSFEIKKFKSKGIEEMPDLVVVEEPLEIRLGFGKEDDRQQKSISVTMRTPTGHDFELALGFLFTEGIIASLDDILSIHYCTDAGRQAEQNIVRVELKPHILINFQSLERHFYATSSCGICGKASIEAIEQKCLILPKNDFKVSAEFIKTLPQILETNQVFFKHTGGLHAAMLLSPSPTAPKGSQKKIVGGYESSPLGAGGYEDIGRHNALDKAIGAALQQNLLPLSESILIMSSRASFELIQKAVMAGIPIMACVGSPSSLAVETAQTLGITLIGFLRENSFNVYSHVERIF
ncbi:MAG: formate dehydrogenase accessory sulfurtransferase FdhD [Emticicia sp.]